MSKYYTCPCLLIEFDPAKTFCLQNSNDLGGDIKTDSVGFKSNMTSLKKMLSAKLLWTGFFVTILMKFKSM